MHTPVQVSAEESIGSPGPGVAHSCVPPDMGASNQTPVLYKASM